MTNSDAAYYASLVDIAKVRSGSPALLRANSGSSNGGTTMATR